MSLLFSGRLAVFGPETARVTAVAPVTALYSFEIGGGSLGGAELRAVTR